MPSARYRHSPFPIRAPIALVLLCAGVGCTTLSNGTHETLVVRSSPPGASVQLSDGQAGTTPTRFKLFRRTRAAVTLSMEGYESTTIQLEPGLSQEAEREAGLIMAFASLVLGLNTFGDHTHLHTVSHTDNRCANGSVITVVRDITYE